MNDENRNELRNEIRTGFAGIHKRLDDIKDVLIAIRGDLKGISGLWSNLRDTVTAALAVAALIMSLFALFWN